MYSSITFCCKELSTVASVCANFVWLAKTASTRGVINASIVSSDLANF